ncbi:hypothetical protein H9L10_00730 [Phycicoccus endophyticus]|uniref:ATP-grasp domain-containing protein n=1 Tax=Phycicoccus endophyticus TaxID=1690220 RepID=A0A7G9R5G4_9MICO|nr:hypothetical protein [Phycicoccus endophyticus]QNN50839.1 hypothetical protein H9L10_00730 [Phycicoccus endophyticus]
MPPELADQPFLPVVVGGHVGAYSLVRAFHEGYGVRSVVVASVGTWVTDHSSVLELLPCRDAVDPEVLLATLEEALGATTLPKLLLATSDSLVETVVALRGRLGADWRIPYVGTGPLERATRKHTFDEVARAAGVSVPATRSLDLADPASVEVEPGFGYPLVVKPTTPAAWAAVSFEGQSKVHTVRSHAELSALLRHIRDAGYHDELVVQDLIPGDDTGMRILTCYCDRSSRVRFAAYGRTLLEEHSPGLLGVPAGILTGRDGETVAQAGRILAELGWVGYANFDLKYDPRDGSTKFFELNPRLGRSNYYVTGTGHNAVRYYVQEWVEDALPDGDDLVETTEETVYSIVPVRTLRWALRPHPELWSQVRRVIDAGGLRNPLHYRAERDPRRWAKVLAGGLSYDRKFHRYYDPQAAARSAG